MSGDWQLVSGGRAAASESQGAPALDVRVSRPGRSVKPDWSLYPPRTRVG
jgi:hypothetical protein